MKTILRLFLLFTFVAWLDGIVCALPAFPVIVAVTQVVCSGANTGSINITPGGGTGRYTYTWSNDSTTQNLNNLGAGTYSVTITDAGGNQGFTTVIVTAPPVFSISKTITNESCGGYDSGAVQLNVSGGTPGYTYNWSNGDTAQNILNVTAAVYHVTITDAHGCAIIDTANVTQPVGVVISSSGANASCGMANGTINITAEYGTPGYTYLWNDGPTTQNRDSLNQGSYVVTVTDSIGCTASASEAVGEAPSGMSANYHTTQPSCYNSNDGKIWMTSVVGSIGPYTFAWNDGDTSRSRTNLPAGTYIITAISGLGCTTTDTIILGQPTGMNILLVEVPYTCFGSNNGSINTTVTNGSSPYTYDWGGGVTSKNRIGLTVGNYTVTVTDHDGCTMAATDTVTQPALLVPSLVATGVSCAGGNTGSIITTTTGGTAAYSYWWGAGITTPNRTNLNAGIYTITVTDAHGCTATASATVAAYTPMAVTVAQTNALCYGLNSGSLHLTVAQGISPFSYLWSSSDTTQNIDSLAAGTYVVTVTDNNSCTVTKSYTITQPAFPITPNVLVAEVSCHADSDGSITINPTDGVAPYTYSWSGGSTSQNLTNLVHGIYNLTVTDNNGCTVATSISVTQPTPITITLTDTNIACFGGATGAIDMSITGSYPPYFYNWNGGSNKQNINSLAAGNYTVTVTDNHNCTALAATTLTQPTNATLTKTVTNVTCNGGNNGAINLGVSGGTSPYTFNWGGGIITQNRTNLLAGNYTVTVTDSAACTYLANATVFQPTAISITPAVTNIICSGSSVGAVTITVSGGIPVYSFNWGGGIITQNRNNLAAGNYTVTVTDSAGCTATNSSTVTQTTGLNLASTITNVSCNGANNGAINISPTSGGGPYTYNWGGGIISQNRANLAPGNYTVSVTDTNGCTGTNTSAITQPNALTATASAVSTTCNGSNDGAINLTVSGGTLPYTYNWGGGITTQNRANLSAGNYTATVTDSAGCTINATATVGQPAALIASPVITNVSCNGGSNGSITLTVTGGTGTYTYNWGAGIATPGRTNLAAGNYSVTITDVNICTVVASASIIQPAAITVIATPTNTTCFGQSTGSMALSVSGGSGAYTYNWTNSSISQNLSNIPAGNYSVTVSDTNLCSATATAIVNQPAQIISTGFVTNAACNGSANGGVVLTVNGGAGGFIYKWSNNSTGQNLQLVDAGNYTVIITDAALCTAANSFAITQPAALIITTSNNNVSCFGGNNGSITDTVSGGSGNYTYNWSNAATTVGINNLLAGTYKVTVKDAANCSATASANITQPAPINISAIAVNVSCNGGSNGSASLNVSGGTPPYVYLWSNNANVAQINNLTVNTYSVTVTDARLCSADTSAAITQPNAILLSENHSDFACATHGGVITLTATGGTGPYNYNWGGGINTASRSSLNAGIYAVTVTDAVACSVTGSIAINQLSQMNALLTKSDLNCYNQNDGYINTVVTGGTQPYRFLWSNNETTPGIIKLGAGVYDVQITDSNACLITASATINQPGQIVITPDVAPVGCSGTNTGSINVNVTGGTPAYAYNWSNQSTAPGISNIAAGTYSLTVIDNQNCSAIAANIVVTQTAPVTALANATSIGCSAANKGNISLAVSGGTAPYSFNWSNQDNTQNISGLTAGDYSVTVTDSKNCNAHATATITASTPIAITSAVQNASCTGVDNGAIDLNVTGGTPTFSYLWSNGANSENLTTLASGNYLVTITDAGGCSVVSNFVIGNDYTLTVNATGTTSINEGQSASIQAVSNVDHNNVYNWGPAEYITCATCALTQAAPPQTTDFTISVIDANGCKATDNLTISVNTQSNIFIPNAFSPNSDGNNDYFQIFGDLGSIVYLDMAVFNRWGEKVFESQEPQFKWDGVYKGEPAPMGVYVYTMTISFADGSHKDYKGSVTLVK